MSTVDPSSATHPHCRDMALIHRIFRTGFAELARLVPTVPPGDAAQVRAVAAHLDFLLVGLRAHHTTEDELVWPALSTRARPSADLVERMEAHTTASTTASRTYSAAAPHGSIGPRPSRPPLSRRRSPTCCVTQRSIWTERGGARRRTSSRPRLERGRVGEGRPGRPSRSSRPRSASSPRGRCWRSRHLPRPRR